VRKSEKWSANPYKNQYFVLRGAPNYFKWSAHWKSLGTTAVVSSLFATFLISLSFSLYHYQSGGEPIKKRNQFLLCVRFETLKCFFLTLIFCNSNFSANRKNFAILLIRVFALKVLKVALSQKTQKRQTYKPPQCYIKMCFFLLL